MSLSFKKRNFCLASVYYIIYIYIPKLQVYPVSATELLKAILMEFLAPFIQQHRIRAFPAWRMVSESIDGTSWSPKYYIQCLLP